MCTCVCGNLVSAAFVQEITPQVKYLSLEAFSVRMVFSPGGASLALGVGALVYVAYAVIVCKAATS